MLCHYTKHLKGKVKPDWDSNPRPVTNAVPYYRADLLRVSRGTLDLQHLLFQQWFVKTVPRFPHCLSVAKYTQNAIVVKITMKVKIHFFVTMFIKLSSHSFIHASQHSSNNQKLHPSLFDLFTYFIHRPSTHLSLPFIQLFHHGLKYNKNTILPFKITLGSGHQMYTFTESRFPELITITQLCITLF